MRTGSLPLTSTSDGNFSLRRTKRKAPSPPSKIPLHQSDENGHVTALQPVDGVSPDSASEAPSPEGVPSPGGISTDSTSLAEGFPGPGLFHQEQCTAPSLPDETSLSEGPGTPEAAVASLTSGISSDYSLEEIDEKEELNDVPKDEAENISLKSPDIPFVSTDIINTLKNDPDLALGMDNGEASQNSKEKAQKARNADGRGPHGAVYDMSNDDMVADGVRNLQSLGPSQKNVQNEIIVLATKTEDKIKNSVRTEIDVEDEAKSKAVNTEGDKLSKHQACETDSFMSSKENHQAPASVPGQKLNQPRAEKTEMQDAAIQTTPSSNSIDGDHQGHSLSDSKVDESVQTPNNKSTQHSPLSLQESVDPSSKLRSQGTLTVPSEDRLAPKDPVSAYEHDDLSSPVHGIDKNSTVSYLKNSPLYRQDYSPKPKPSNEITREYIPKIGMTTYKIVPPKSLEVLKDWESEIMVFKDNHELHTLEKKPAYKNVKETSMQTESPATSEGPEEPDRRPQPGPRPGQPLHRAMSFPEGAPTHPPKPPRTPGDTGAPFAPTLEDINSILESKIRPRASNPQAKPNSFFLQMQKRASGHYVTSAAAKSTHAAPNPALRELPTKDTERDTLPSPEQTPPLSKMTPCTPQPHIKNADEAAISRKPAPPPIAPKPLPATQPAAANLKTLKTFGAPRPFSSSAPSPFALAVVKRSQSFSKTRTESSSEGAPTQPPGSAEEGKLCSAQKFSDIPQLDVTEKQNNSAHNEQNSQMPTPADCPSFTLERQSSLTSQSSDPEEIRQSLLTAIRSGEAAAKLKRVTVPSNTISVNGRSRLSHSLSSDAQEGC